MRREKRTIIIILVAAILVGGATRYHYFTRSPKTFSGNLTSAGGVDGGTKTSTTASATPVGGKNNQPASAVATGIEIDESGKSVPQSVSSKNSVPAPDLDRPITFAADLAPKEREALMKEIQGIIVTLKANHDAFNSWVALGIERKAIGDLEGARDAWEYASAIRPHNSVSFGNLGDLYGYYLHDPQKAEQRFLTAVKNDPTLTYLLLQTADFYSGVLKDRPRAIAFLKQSVKNNPGNAEIKKILESY